MQLLLILVWQVLVEAFGWGSLMATVHIMNAVLATVVPMKLLQGSHPPSK